MPASSKSLTKNKSGGGGRKAGESNSLLEKYNKNIHQNKTRITTLQYKHVLFVILKKDKSKFLETRNTTQK